METPGPDPQLLKEQRHKAEKLRLAKIERHIFLCCDPTKAKCCSRKRTIREPQMTVDSGACKAVA